MDKELEKIIKEVNEKLSKRPFKGEEGKSGIFIDFFLEIVYRENPKYIEFQGEFGEGILSIKEIKPLLDYIDKKGYRTNLKKE